MSYALPTLCHPVDNLTGTLSAAHVIGSGTLILTDPSALAAASPSPTAPVRLTVLAPDGMSALGQFKVTGLSGNSATVVVDDGWVDVALPSGSKYAATIAAETIGEIQGALGGLTNALNTISLTPGSSGVAHATAPLAYDPTSQTVSLTTSGVTPGTYANATVTVDAHGLVTAVSAGSGSGGSATPEGASGAIQYNGGSALAGSDTFFVSTSGLQARYTAPNTGDQIPQTALYLRDDGQTTDFVRRGMVLDTHAATLGVAGYLRTGAAITLPAGSTTYNEVAAVDVGWDSTGNGEILFWTGGRFNGDTAPSLAASIDRDGVLQVNKGLRYGASTTLVVGFTNSADSAASLVVGTFSGRKGLVLQGNQYGGGNVLEVQTGPNDGGTALASLDSAGAYHPPRLADADAQANSLYFSTTLGRLAFKDASGTAHALYS